MAVGRVLAEVTWVEAKPRPEAWTLVQSPGPCPPTTVLVVSVDVGGTTSAKLARGGGTLES